MLEQAHCLLIDQLRYHVTKDSADSIETLICLADVLQAHVVKQYFLDDEDGNRLAEF